MEPKKRNASIENLQLMNQKRHREEYSSNSSTLQSLFSTNFHYTIKHYENKIIIQRSDRPGISAKIIFSTTTNNGQAKVESVFCKEEVRGLGVGRLLFAEVFASLNDNKNSSTHTILLDAEEDTTRHNRLVSYYQDLGFNITSNAKIQFLNNNDTNLYRKVPMSLKFNLRNPLKAKLEDAAAFLMVRLLCDSDSDGHDSLFPDEGAAEQSPESVEAENPRLKEDRVEKDPWVLCQIGEGRFLFKTTSGLHLCSEPDGRIVADRTLPSTWECFQLLQSNESDKLVLKTFHDTYVSVDDAKHLCSSKNLTEWTVGDFSLRCSSTSSDVKKFYESWWRTQSVEYVATMKERYGKFELGEYSIFEILWRTSTSSRSLAFQTAERARKAGHPQYVQFVLLVCLLSQAVIGLGDGDKNGDSELFDWTLECQTRVLGCPAPAETRFFSEFNSVSPDLEPNLPIPSPLPLPLPLGLMNPQLTYTYSGLTYMTDVLEHANCSMPFEGFLLLKLLNLDLWFRNGHYANFQTQQETEMKPLLLEIDDLRRLSKRACMNELSDDVVADLWADHYSEICASFGVGGILSW